MKNYKSFFSKINSEKLAIIFLISLFVLNLFLGERWSTFSPINSIFLNINEYLLALLLIIFFVNERNILFKQKFKTLIFISFIIYYFSKNQIENLYFFAFDLSPLVLFYYFYFLSYKKVNIHKIQYFVNSKTLSILSGFFLIDYLIDRKFAYKVFNNFEIKNIDLSSFSLMQSSAIILLLFALILTIGNPLGNISIIPVWIFFGFAMLESRLTTVAYFVFFLFYIYLKKITKKHIFAALIGISICFLIPQNDISDIQLGVNESELFKVTRNTPKCFISNFNFLSREADCQIASGNLGNPKTVSRADIINNYCEDTLIWRTTLWKAMYQDQIKSIENIFFGTGAGFNIIERVLPKDIVKNCYDFSVQQGLRSGHSTIFNFGYRFGLLNLIFLLLLIVKFLLKSGDVKFNFIILFFGFYSIFDPILDSPTIAIPFWILFFFYTKEKIEY